MGTISAKSLPVFRHLEQVKISKMLVNSDERFKHIDPDAANLIKASLNFDISFPPKSCEVNMCRAIKEIKKEAYENGEKVGFENGVKQKAKQTALNLIRMHVLSYHEIAAATQLPLTEVQALATEVQN